MPVPNDDILQRKLEREIHARKQAEALLEQKSLELFIEAQERQNALSKLRESEERYRLIVENSPNAILVDIEDHIVFANGAARRMFAESESATLKGFTLRDLGIHIEATGANPDPRERIETIANRLDGRRIEVAVRSMSMVYDGKAATQIVINDISVRKQLERELAYQATHDALTGVSNRIALMEQLEHALAYAKRHNLPVWVAFLDLDHFKQINDRFGHRAGDLLLETVTARLRQLLRKGDIIGRYGGDEFILVLRGGTDDTLNSQLLDRIMQVVSEPIDMDGHPLQVTCSLGVAAFPDDGDRSEVLLERADAAMYRVKESGRNLYQLYNEDIHARLEERLQVERHLVDALSRNEFFLLYQPKVDISTGEVQGVEALLRWRHPELGVLSPEHFIPLAEETTLINDIGRWVLDEACRQCAAWHRDGMSSLSVAVNLSAQQLNGPCLVQLVSEVLAASGLPPSSLELELTETMMMADVDLTMRTMRTLQEMGLRMAVDDFGTGYSSFAYLNFLPLSCMKIDRQFVIALDKTGAREAALLTRALIQLAHSLDLTVVAEGVETPQQLQVLREQGCDQIQGWLHSQPMMPEALATMLRDFDAGQWLVDTGKSR